MTISAPNLKKQLLRMKKKNGAQALKMLLQGQLLITETLEFMGKCTNQRLI